MLAHTARASLCRQNSATMSVRNPSRNSNFLFGPCRFSQRGPFLTTPSRKGPVARQGQFPCYTGVAALLLWQGQRGREARDE